MYINTMNTDLQESPRKMQFKLTQLVKVKIQEIPTLVMILRSFQKGSYFLGQLLMLETNTTTAGQYIVHRCC